VVAAAALSLVACAGTGTGPGNNQIELPPPPAGAVRALFVGNSLTYVNDLPRTVADLAVSAGLAQLYAVMVAFPNFALEDHLAEGTAAQVLRQMDFDFVVMQQGSSALPASRELLIRDAKAFAPIITAAHARPVMFMVWPSASRFADFPDVRDSYRAAADSIGGLFAPGGASWLEAWERDASLALYSPDGLHPTPMGTYAAALTIFARLYDRSPVGVQTVARVSGVNMPWPEETVRLLQEAAASAVTREGHP
jgi:hypothetical protein